MAYEKSKPVRPNGWLRRNTPQEWEWAWHDLVFCLPGWDGGGGPIDLVLGRVGSMQSTAGYAVGPVCNMLSFSGGTTAVTFADETTWQNAGSVTVAALHQPSATSQTGLCVRAASASPGAYWALIYSFSSNSKYSFWNDNNATGPASVNTFGAGTTNFAIGRRVGTNTSSPTLDIFVNGALEATTTSTGIDGQWNNSGSGYLLAVNQFGGFAGYRGSGLIGPVYIWNRALSDSEIARISDDPWGPLRQVSKAFVPGLLQDSSGADFIGTGGAGSLAISGQSGSVVADAILSGGVGSIGVSGQIGSVAAGATLIAGAGSLAITGSAGAAVLDVVLSGGAGGLSLSGSAGTLVIDTIISGGAGALSLSGSAGAFSASFPGLAGVGSIVISGAAGSISADFVGAGGASALSIAGLPAAVSYDAVLDGGSGALTITGYQAALSAGTVLGGGLGALAITGLPAGVSADAVLAGGSGALTISGQAGLFSTSGDFVAEGGSGSLAITGLAGDVAAEFFGIAGASSVSIAGQAGSVSAGAGLAAGAGSITIDGLAGDVSADAILDGAASSLAMTGFPADVSADANVTADVGALVIEGFAGDVIAGGAGDAIVVGGLGELVIAGYQGEVVALNEWVPGQSAAGGSGWSGWRWPARALKKLVAKPQQDAIKVGRLPPLRLTEFTGYAGGVSTDTYLDAGAPGGLALTGHPADLFAERIPDDALVMEMISGLLPQFFGDRA